MPSSARTAALVLAALSLLVMTLHMLRGPNFVLDDWYNLRAASDPTSFMGVDRSHAAGRPGFLLAYGITYNIIGNHPLGVVAFLTAIHTATTVSLFGLLTRFLPQRTAFLAVTIWVISPNHMSIEIWSSTVMVALSLLATVVGADLLARRERSSSSDARSIIMFALAALLYEASMPVIAFLVIALPWVVERRLRYKYIAVAGLTQSAIAAWIIGHWHESRSSRGIVALFPIVTSHFGEGLTGSGVLGALLLCAVIVSASVLIFRDLPRLRAERRSERTRDVEPLLVSVLAVSLAVVVLGALPFAFYFYTSEGPGDRVLYLSSVASSVILAALYERALRVRRRLALICLVPLVLGVGLQRWQKSADWDWAGDEGLAIISSIHSRFPEAPSDPIVVGPAPVSRGNVAPFVDHSNLRGAMAVLYPGANVEAYVAHDRASFDRFEPTHRFDLDEIAKRSANGASGS